MDSKLLWIALAGAVGTLARYGIYQLVPKWTSDSFPWSTLVVNVLGCYLFGVVWILAERRLHITEETRLIVLTGFMGAFTTYSTYAFETGQMLRDGHWWSAFANLSAQTILGIGALFLGFATARTM